MAGTALTGLQLQATYSGLLKTSDNAVVNTVLRTVTDGLGNDTALQVSSAGIASTATLAVGGVATISSLTASSAVATNASKELVSVTNTGSGNNVLATSPTLVTPILGTPTSGTLTNCTGLPVSTGISGLGTGVATALAVNTGSAGAPVLFNGALGTPTSGTVTNLTGTASININGTVGATTPNTGSFTTIAASSTLSVTGNSTLTGIIGVGTSPFSAQRINLGGTSTGATSMHGMYSGPTIANDVTSLFNVYSSVPATNGGGAGLTALNHFVCASGTLTGTVTTQVGFNALSTLSGGTNNYGFRGQLASATNSYNLYMDGTAQNYLAGELGIGVAASSTTQLVLAASTTAKSSLRIPHGSAPTSPVNGDIWTTTAGLFVRINGSTVGPLS